MAIKVTNYRPSSRKPPEKRKEMLDGIAMVLVEGKFFVKAG